MHLSLLIIFCSGIFSAAMQCIALREALAVCSGNEIILVVMLCAWMLATAAGCLTGNNFFRSHASLTISHFCLGLILLSIVTIAGVRMAAFLAPAGASLDPLLSFLIIAAAIIPFAFVNGFCFGYFSGRIAGVRHALILENAGTLVGFFLCSLALIWYAPHWMIFLLAAFPLLLLLCLQGRLIAPLLCCTALGLGIFFDGPSARFKYPQKVDRIVYGHRGEYARVISGHDTSWFCNNKLLTSPPNRALYEQAVGIPLALRPHASAVCAFNDAGLALELARYKNISTTILAEERLLASSSARIGSLYGLAAPHHFDVLYCSASLPESFSQNQPLTLEFAQHARALLKPGGILAISIPLNSQYQSPLEKQGCVIIRSTLHAAFTNVLIFPGEGLTIMASDSGLNGPYVPLISTSYLASMIIPSLSPQALARLNDSLPVASVNSVKKPLLLNIGWQRWLHIFAPSFLMSMLGIFIVFSMIGFTLPRKRMTVSIGTTGFFLAGQSLTLLLVFQGYFGNLYGQYALLMALLTAGFTLGNLIKRFKAADFCIGIFALGTLLLLNGIAQPLPLLFYGLQFVTGLLGGAHLASQKNESAAPVFAADLWGGVAGTLLVPLVILPWGGVAGVAVLLGFLKACAGGINLAGKNS